MINPFAVKDYPVVNALWNTPSEASVLGKAITFLCFSSVLFLFSVSASAACKGQNCACTPSQIQLASPAMTADENGVFPMSLEADNVEAQGDDLVILQGDAEVMQGRQTVVADLIKYYRQSERAQAEGNIELISENGDYIAADSLDIHVPSQVGTVNGAEFKLAEALVSKDGIDTININSRGSAEVVGLEGEGVLRLTKTKYTTCPEGNDSVIVGARELELDRNAGIAKARGATVRFKGVPLFYTPYISFPINDERKTGFLTPGFGSDEESGNVFEFPWYWNIAKNQDATITPRYYTDRGLQLAAEYRRRTPYSSTYIYGEVLPSDDLFGDDRDMISIRHSQDLAPGLSMKVNYNDVSDIDYFTDLRNQARYFSATYVPRDINFRYRHDYFTLGVRANEYQIIDDRFLAVSPYERLPSVSFSSNLPDGPMGLKYGVNASYTNFSADVRVEGTRTAIDPYIQLPLETLWGYIRPGLRIHSRSYSLDNVAEGAEDSPSFTVPVATIDAGLFFEKNTKWFGDSVLQTLEPRVFYAYAPDEDQSDVPLFDTSQVALNNFSNIFRGNRFYGGDRVGDTNQLTLGLTTRLIDNESGDQRLVASIGQLVLLDDLEQNLFSNQIIESGLGDLLAELRTESDGAWSTYTFLQYDHEESELRTARFSLGYEPKDDSRKNIQLSYYYSNRSNQDVDQIALSANWPVSDRWQFFGSERYSLEDSESLSTTLGLEYNGCCWKFRVIATDRINNRFGRQNALDEERKRSAIFFELELTSLGRIRTGL